MNVDMLKALVTGGTGFLGKALVERLHRDGAKVRSLSRHPSEDLAKLGIEQVEGDIADPQAVSEAAAGCNVVFHTAAKAGIWGRYEEYYATNVTGTVNVIAACHRHGIQRLVYTSSPSVVAPEGNLEAVDESVDYADEYLAHYPRTKAMAERMVLAANDDQLRTVSLRPHLIWGPGDNHLLPRLLKRARKHRLRIVGDGKNLVDSVYIDNAVDAHVQAAVRLNKGDPICGKTYFITNGEPLPIEELINSLLDTAGLPPVKKRIAADKAFRIGERLEKLYRFLRLRREPPMTRFLAHQLSTSHYFDISAAQRDLGYRVDVTVKQGLERLREWMPKAAYA